MDTGGKGFVSKADLLRIARLRDPALGITDAHADKTEKMKASAIPEAESEDSDDFFKEPEAVQQERKTSQKKRVKIAVQSQRKQSMDSLQAEDNQLDITIKNTVTRRHQTNA